MAPMLKHIIIYPVKSCQGVSVDSAELTEQGTLKGDREWCVVDLNGKRYPKNQSLSARLCPALLSIKVALEADGTLVLEAPGMLPLEVPPDAGKGGEKGDTVVVECGGASTTSAGSWHLGLLPGYTAGSDAEHWLSAYLNQALKSGTKDAKGDKDTSFGLVKAAAVRMLSTYAGPDQVPFSPDLEKQRSGEGSPFRMKNVPVQATDGFLFHDVAPLHLGSADSFQALQEAMRDYQASGGSTSSSSSEDVDSYSIQSFRPNLVVEGAGAWDEETWASFRVTDPKAVGAASAVRFQFLKGCPRCSVPARAPSTGDFHFGPPTRLLPQIVLRKLFPEKAVDQEWEEEWQGPIFGVHVAPLSVDAAAGKCLRTGSRVSVTTWTPDSPRGKLAMVLTLLKVLFVLIPVIVGGYIQVFDGHGVTPPLFFSRVCLPLEAGRSSVVQPFDNSSAFSMTLDGDASLLVSAGANGKKALWTSPKPACRQRQGKYRCQPKKADVRVIETWNEQGRHLELRARPQRVGAETIYWSVPKSQVPEVVYDVLRAKQETDRAKDGLPAVCKGFGGGLFATSDRWWTSPAPE